MSVLWAAVVYAQLQLVLDDSLKAPNGIDFPPSSLLSFSFCVLHWPPRSAALLWFCPSTTKLMGGNTRESRKKRHRRTAPAPTRSYINPFGLFILFSFCLGLTYLRRDPPQILFLKDFCVRVVQHQTVQQAYISICCVQSFFQNKKNIFFGLLVGDNVARGLFHANGQVGKKRQNAGSPDYTKSCWI